MKTLARGKRNPEHERPAGPVRPVILGGGAGTRLWPVSRLTLPKQLLPLGRTETLLQATVQRCIGPLFLRPLIVTAEDHRFLVQEQLAEIGAGADAILLEPAGRNTAPAIGLAAFWQASQAADQLMLVLPADHSVQDITRFRQALLAAIPAAQAGDIVTFGIRPTSPETGYGYIEPDPADAAPAPRIAAYREKPTAEAAANYAASGRHLWNSGMFLFRADTIISELARHCPAVAEGCERAIQGASIDQQFVRPAREAFLQMPSVAIDYAVMEKTAHGRVVPVDMGWSDVGSWDSLWALSDKDSQGNVVSPNVIALETQSSLIRTDTDATIAVLGVKDLAVIATRDAILVLPRNRAQDTKLLVDALAAAGLDKCSSHARVNRPWGSYEVMDRGERFQTKRIIVKPGAKLSLQMHHHRSEHWVVVSGTALVTIDGKSRLLQENESSFIPLGSTHRLENPGKVPLNLVEIQCGAYLGEDDIVRFEDDYGRAAEAEGQAISAMSRRLRKAARWLVSSRRRES